MIYRRIILGSFRRQIEYFIVEHRITAVKLNTYIVALQRGFVANNDVFV